MKFFALALVASACAHGPAPLPTLELEASGGGTGRVAAGRPQAIAFLATYCLPCIAQLPALGKLAKDYRGRVEVVGVYFDVEGDLTVQPFLERYHPPFPSLLAGDDVAIGASPFGKISELPATLFLDRDGRPVASVSGVASLETLEAGAQAALR